MFLGFLFLGLAIRLSRVRRRYGLCLVILDLLFASSDEGGIGHDKYCNLHQPQALQAGMAVLADNDVVVNADAERAGDVDNRFCHLDIGR